MNQNQAGDSILEVLLEKASNIEHSSNKVGIKKFLSEEIKTEGKKEIRLRHETISICLGQGKSVRDKEEIIKEIENSWVTDSGKLPPTHWFDKENLYVQFATAQDKNEFLDLARIQISNKNDSVLTQIARPNSEGLHFTRRMVRIIIPNVKNNIKTDLIQANIEKMFKGNRAKVEEFKEGKSIQGTGSIGVRNIMFKIDALGFRILFKGHDGVIPYLNASTNTRMKLIARINARPFQCRDCSMLGTHHCKGKLCGQCGQIGHMSKECKSKTKFCSNCKRKGHKARDTHCPGYLKEMVKELRRMDVPEEFLIEQEFRDTLIKHMQLK